ncbi:MAG: hypothetical protein ACJA0U_002557 [Salibacteraceae bacterium]|jgi:hypothetical protein
MTQKSKRILGVGILVTLMGVLKIYTKGIYTDNNEIHWFNLLAPFGMGLLVICYSLFLIYTEKSNN